MTPDRTHPSEVYRTVEGIVRTHLAVFPTFDVEPLADEITQTLTKTYLAEATRSKDLMATALHEAQDRANRMERHYLDIESGGVHFDLQAAREFWAESEKQSAADKQRLDDVIAELRKQVEWARKLRGRAEQRRHEAEADNLEMLQQREQIRAILDTGPPAIDAAENLAAAHANGWDVCRHAVAAVLDGTPKETP